MSLGIGIKGPEGIVLAAESRATLINNLSGGNMAIPITYDHATKLLSFGEIHNYVGAVTYGLASIGQRTAHSFLSEFESQLGDLRLPIQEFAQKLSDFYMSQWNAQTGLPSPYTGSPMNFVIAGFDDSEPYGKIYEVVIPTSPTPREVVPNGEDFNIVWGGDRKIVDRIIQGIDPELLGKIQNDLSLSSSQKTQLNTIYPTFGIPLIFNAMALQDCVDLAIFLIRTTIDAQKLTASFRTCGGPIDVAIITKGKGLEYVQKKTIKGE